jgi:hypothetical protein
MNSTNRLIDMKDKIEVAKSNIARMQGSRDQLYKTLQIDHRCKTLKEAENKLIKMTKDFDQKEIELTKGIEELEEKYDWN